MNAPARRPSCWCSALPRRASSAPTALQAQFLAEYQRRVEQANSVRADGKRLLVVSIQSR
jgi:hypothetical protein